MQIAFETPQAKYAYRLLECFLYESTKCHLPVPFYMVLTHLVATFLMLQVVLTMSEDRFRVSSLQPTCFACGYMKMMETPCRIMFSAVYSFQLAKFQDVTS